MRFFQDFAYSLSMAIASLIPVQRYCAELDALSCIVPVDRKYSINFRIIVDEISKYRY
jgi:hypothetical protein